MECREVLCYGFRSYVNGTCKAVLKDITGICSDLFLQFVPQTTVSLQEEPYFYSFISNYVKNEMIGDIISEISEIFSLEILADDVFGPLITPSSYVVAKVHLCFEKYPLNLAENVLGFGNIIHNVTMQGHSLEFTVRVVNPKLYNVKNGSEIEAYMSDDGRLLLARNTIKARRFCQCVGEPLPVLKYSLCPLIQLGAEYKPKWHSNDSGLFIDEFDIFIGRGEYIEDKQNGTILVCVESYLSAESNINPSQFFPPEQARDIARDVDLVLAYVSLTCTSISVLCLLLTIATYLKFPELRTQPGINNICLCFSLLFAQLLYQFGTEQKEKVPRWACVTVGALIHFLWLNVAFWMNVCSVHMFRVFAFKLQNTVTSSTKTCTTLKYLLYTNTTSAFFVAANMAASYVRSNKENLGYGEGMNCYISTPFMVGMTFALPLGIIVLINICLFIAVVVQIRARSATSARATNVPNFLLIYTKLSFFTGMYWTVGYLFVITKVKALEYIFIVLIAGQGVFIMASFVFNRKVCKKKIEQQAGLALHDLSKRQ